MVAKTTWMRVMAFALALLIAYTPAAFAGPLRDSAVRAAAEMGARTAAPGDVAVAGSFAPSAVEARASAAMQGDDSGGSRMNPRNVWTLIGAGVGLGLIMLALDRNTEDSTPSSLRQRRDGCTLFCQ